MATNLIRKLYQTGRKAAIRAYTGYRALKGASEQYQRTADARVKSSAKMQKQAGTERKKALAARSKAVKARVKGVRKVTRSVTTGSRLDRAKQIRQLRQNPHTRATLRRRTKFYTV